MRTIVLGAGIAGTLTAYHLLREGHEVTVVDRQPGAGMETSFANGGFMASSQAEPWAAPGVPLKLLKWLGREDAPLLLRPSAVPQMRSARPRQRRAQFQAGALQHRGTEAGP